MLSEEYGQQRADARTDVEERAPPREVEQHHGEPEPDDVVGEHPGEPDQHAGHQRPSGRDQAVPLPGAREHAGGARGRTEHRDDRVHAHRDPDRVRREHEDRRVPAGGHLATDAADAVEHERDRQRTQCGDEDRERELVADADPFQRPQHHHRSRRMPARRDRVARHVLRVRRDVVRRRVADHRHVRCVVGRVQQRPGEAGGAVDQRERQCPSDRDRVRDEQQQRPLQLPDPAPRHQEHQRDQRREQSRTG